MDERRITLVTRGKNTPLRDWDASREAANRIIFLEALTVLRYAIAGGIGGGSITQDVERVILDHSASAAEFLDLLASLPHEFAGDVLYIGLSDHSYMSSTGRGGDRVLYALKPHDLHFYLETHGLIASRPEVLTLSA